MPPDRKGRQQQRPKATAKPTATHPTKAVAVTPEDAAAPVLRRKVVVRLGRLDLGGPWCLSRITPEDHLRVLQFIQRLETMKVGEVFNGSIGKDEDVAGASPNTAAQRRAAEIYPDDSDQIARVEVGSVKRLWGLRYEHEFHLIWWDPDHEVWPSKKKRT